ncbi:keratin, type II cytoskeletal 80 [Malaclemys terrapin pileata]|uniref:keratin, type II cytoskeletal 80 n=1 Tax=Malaclemys terrapin pileata TaxID=2991368 RepID=UPI0023A88C0A|nr:keratin, type II cytoskeletal 80 [Malaclemys terrapin pileata]
MTSRSNEFSSSSLSSWQASWNQNRGSSVVTSSEYDGCSSPGGPASRSFSTSSLGGYTSSSCPSVFINEKLLTPLRLDLDPTFQERKKQEKDEMKILNDQFASLIGKVQCLEQQNKVLTIRWSFLKDQDNSRSELDIKLLYDQYMSKLKQEMRAVGHEREQLESELTEVLKSMDNIRNRYEDEIHKRSGLEFTFVELKRDLDAGSMHRTELEVKLQGLQELMELKKAVYEQELQELLAEIKDISVVMGIDNRCNLDLSRIVEEVRAQYEALAFRSWEEAEALTWSKLNEGATHSATYRDQLFSGRREIAELTIRIQKLRTCIVSLKSQCLRLEEDIKEAGGSGQLALRNANAKLAELEQALHKGKADLAGLVKEYHELMNIKLALDVEILTYRKLVEGEESSMESPTCPVISSIHSSPRHFSSISSFSGSSQLASRARGNSTDGMIRNGAVAEAVLARSQSGGSASRDADERPSGARPKHRLLSDEEHCREESIPAE